MPGPTQHRHPAPLGTPWPGSRAAAEPLSRRLALEERRARAEMELHAAMARTARAHAAAAQRTDPIPLPVAPTPDGAPFAASRPVGRKNPLVVVGLSIGLGVLLSVALAASSAQKSRPQP